MGKDLKGKKLPAGPSTRTGTIISVLSMYTIRHTFATRCIEAGMRPKTLQGILEHANIGITMNLYVHNTEEEKEKEIKKFEEAFQLRLV